MSSFFVDLHGGVSDLYLQRTWLSFVEVCEASGAVQYETGECLYDMPSCHIMSMLFVQAIEAIDILICDVYLRYFLE